MDVISNGKVDYFITRNRDQLLKAKTPGFSGGSPGGMSQLIFHLDELELSEWEDRKTTTVIVPSRVEQDLQAWIHRGACVGWIYNSHCSICFTATAHERCAIWSDMTG
jgi:hypothetical protein